MSQLPGAAGSRRDPDPTSWRRAMVREGIGCEVRSASQTGWLRHGALASSTTTQRNGRRFRRGSQGGDSGRSLRPVASSAACLGLARGRTRRPRAQCGHGRPAPRIRTRPPPLRRHRRQRDVGPRAAGEGSRRGRQRQRTWAVAGRRGAAGGGIRGGRGADRLDAARRRDGGGGVGRDPGGPPRARRGPASRAAGAEVRRGARWADAAAGQRRGRDLRDAREKFDHRDAGARAAVVRERPVLHPRGAVRADRRREPVCGRRGGRRRAGRAGGGGLRVRPQLPPPRADARGGAERGGGPPRLLRRPRRDRRELRRLRGAAARGRVAADPARGRGAAEGVGRGPHPG